MALLSEIMEHSGLVDILRSGGIILFFTIGAFWFHRKVWFTFEIIFSLATGVGYILIPKTLVDFQITGDLDPVHVMILRLFGAQCLAATFIYIPWRDQGFNATLGK